MKKLITISKIGLFLSPILITAACNHTAARYEDLVTGEKVYIVQDEERGIAVDSITKKPVDFYVDLETKDTINGKTGMVVNNSIIKTPEGIYVLDEAKIKSDGDEYKAKSEDVKIKVDGDDMKIKTDNKKIKIEDGEKKIKYKD